MEGTTDLFTNSVVFLSAAVIAVPLAQRFGLGTVLGYLLAGIVIGPWGLRLISDVENVMHFAEFGVVLLLFIIGLELNPKKLWQMRVPILGLGGAQVVLSTIVITLVAYQFDLSWQTSLIIGMSLALSSTAIALRVMDEQGMSGTETGQSGFAILLFQDIAVIPMLALMPLMSLTGATVGDADAASATNSVDALWMLLGVAGLLVGGHYLLRPIFRYIVMSKVSEIFTVAALLLVIGIAMLMQSIGLSMALGSFLAGVLLADSEYRHELERAIDPFKGLLLGLFFMSVGMAIDLGMFLQYPFRILLAVVGLVAVKALILYILAYISGAHYKSCSRMAIILSQGGEFAFVLFSAAATQNLISDQTMSFLLVVVSLSMMTTPLLLLALKKWEKDTINIEETLKRDVVKKESQVIIVGFGRFGQVVGRMCFANNIRITVLENDPAQTQLLRKFGYKVYYGDATQVDTLRTIGASKAEAIVLCTNDPAEVLEIAQLCQQHFPNLKILARARSRIEAYQLLNMGVTNFSRETFHSSLDLGRQLLVTLGMHPYRAQRAQAKFQKLDDAMLEELLPQHSDDQEMSIRAKEARKDLEEIFAKEMDKDRRTMQSWDD